MELDKTVLNSRVFTAFSETSGRRYIYLYNMQTGICRWGRNAVEYFGLPAEYMENAGEIWAEHIHPDDRDTYLKDIQAVFEGKKDRHDVDYRARDKDGNYVMCTCQGLVLKGENGEPDLFAGTIENHGIVDNVDATTNLYNIYEFWQFMRKMKEKNVSEYVLLVGINHFSEINDVYGYSFGDRVLKEFGVLILDLLKGAGTVYRMDGVRFACCIPQTTEEFILEIYTKIQHMARHNIVIDDIRISISISGGAVLYGGDYDEYSVQGSARYALNQSKHERHGELVFFDDMMLNNNRKNLELLGALRRSILNDCSDFYLCYQPIISAKEEKLIGMEALLRWNKEPFGEVSPGIFIPWLENDPSFFDLGNWILKRALTEGKQLIEHYPDFILNVNISYTQLARINFRQALVRILEETGFPAKNLCLELTERCRQLEREYLRNEVTYLQSLGIKIALDDFGTGFSSLNLLSELPIDTLKIDRGFLMGIEDNIANQAVVKAVTECADNLDIRVCMEGIENRELINFVKKYAVYSYQGYYYSRPIRMEQFLEKYLDYVS